MRFFWDDLAQQDVAATPARRHRQPVEEEAKAGEPDVVGDEHHRANDRVQHQPEDENRQTAVNVRQTRQRHRGYDPPHEVHSAEEAQLLARDAPQIQLLHPVHDRGGLGHVDPHPATLNIGVADAFLFAAESPLSTRLDALVLGQEFKIGQITDDHVTTRDACHKHCRGDQLIPAKLVRSPLSIDILRQSGRAFERFVPVFDYYVLARL